MKKKNILSLAIFFLVGLGQAAELKNIDTVQNETLQQVAAKWSEVTNYLVKNRIGSNIEYVEFEVVKQSYNVTNPDETLYNSMLQMWYTYSKVTEYGPEVNKKISTSNVDALNLKNLLEEVITGWNGDDVFIPKKMYNKLVWICKALNNSTNLKLYLLEQSFSDGGYNGTLIIDPINSESIILGNRLAI